jgi:hypothetical protein
VKINAIIFGPKVGRFQANLGGNPEEMTIDTWAMRTWLRWHNAIKAKAANATAGRQLNVTPGPVVERDYNTLTRQLGKKFNMPITDVQAILWYYEKRMEGRMGITDVEGEVSSYARAAEKAFSADPGGSRSKGQGDAEVGDDAQLSPAPRGHAGGGWIGDAFRAFIRWVSDEFVEAEHPRDPNGEFTEKGGGVARKAPTSHIHWENLKSLGETKNFQEAGFIKPDGKLIDMSAGGKGERGYDHSFIGGEAGKSEFIALGNIRMDGGARGPGANGGMLDIGKEPTSEQYDQIAKLAYEVGISYITLQEGLGKYIKNDLEPKGFYQRPERWFYRAYPEDTRPERVVADIKKFYAGEQPLEMHQQSERAKTAAAFKGYETQTLSPKQAEQTKARSTLIEKGIAKKVDWDGLGEEAITTITSTLAELTDDYKKGSPHTVEEWDAKKGIPYRQEIEPIGKIREIFGEHSEYYSGNLAQVVTDLKTHERILEYSPDIEQRLKSMTETHGLKSRAGIPYYSTARDVKSVFTHEFAHIIDGAYDWSFSKVFEHFMHAHHGTDKEGYERIGLEIPDLPTEEKGILGDYCKTNVREYFAEYYSAYKQGMLKGTALEPVEKWFKDYGL